MQLSYYGQSAFQIDDESGTRILIDPWITNNPHCKATLDDFVDVDAVLVTHGGFDHVEDAPEIARRNDATLLCDPATQIVLEQADFPSNLLYGYVWGAEHDGGNWSAKIVEARHSSIYADEEIIGPPLAYIISIDGERIYHMGDTSIFRDIKLFAELYQPTISLIPVGEAEGYFTELHPNEAALAAEWLDSDIAIPMHYPPGSEKPAKFEKHCQSRGIDDTTQIELLEPNSSLKR